MQTEPSTGVLRQIPRSVWVLGCVSLLMDVSSEIIHSLLPMFLMAGTGASATAIGVIEGSPRRRRRSSRCSPAR